MAAGFFTGVFGFGRWYVAYERVGAANIKPAQTMAIRGVNLFTSFIVDRAYFLTIYALTERLITWLLYRLESIEPTPQPGPVPFGLTAALHQEEPQ